MAEGIIGESMVEDKGSILYFLIWVCWVFGVNRLHSVGFEIFHDELLR